MQCIHVELLKGGTTFISSFNCVELWPCGMHKIEAKMCVCVCVCVCVCACVRTYVCVFVCGHVPFVTWSSVAKNYTTFLVDMSSYCFLSHTLSHKQVHVLTSTCYIIFLGFYNSQQYWITCTPQHILQMHTLASINDPFPVGFYSNSVICFWCLYQLELLPHWNSQRHPMYNKLSMM